MTYWIVIAMIFVAILAVAVATSNSPDPDRRGVSDDVAPAEEGITADEHF